MQWLWKGWLHSPQTIWQLAAACGLPMHSGHGSDKNCLQIAQFSILVFQLQMATAFHFFNSNIFFFSSSIFLFFVNSFFLFIDSIKYV
jgi:hypothetical protein